MCFLGIITALSITMVSLFCTNDAFAFEATFKLPCTISYHSKPEIATFCIVNISVSQGVMVERVKTPNGRAFIIANDNTQVDEWYLNHERAVKVSDEPSACYQNQQVKICL